MATKILIVGGVAGGASAAARVRRLDENAEIILFEKGEYISYANCGLPYYIGGTISDREMLFVQTPEGMNQQFNIDVRTQNEVMKIDPHKKVVEVRDILHNKIYEESYDALILSPGSKPLQPSIPGIKAPNIFTLWNVPDVDAIQSFIKQNKPSRAVVVGGGFIGLEMAENLYQLGMKVSIVEMADQVMAPMDYDMASLVHSHILSQGVHLYLKDGVKEFIHTGASTSIKLQSGRSLEADIVLLSIGIKPNTDFIKDSGIDLNPRGGIVVNEFLQTSMPDVYAVGDAIEVKDFVNKSSTMIPLAGPANKQGRIVANNIMGRKQAYKGTQGTSIVKIFDLSVGMTGNNEKTLKNTGISYKHSITDSKSHAGYYPGALPMTIKLIYSETGAILGAQIVGYDGVDKRIDVIASALRFERSVFDLQELELAYAPPYSSAKDPVNMAGYVASNILQGDVHIAHWDEIAQKDAKQTLILDIREDIEREIDYIPNSVHIPLHALRDRMHELPKDKEIIVYCQIGQRAYTAYRILLQNGFTQIKNLSGGYKFYQTIRATQQNLLNQNDEFGDEIVMNDNKTKQAIYNTETSEVQYQKEVVQLNACGLSCPGPIMQVYKKMNDLKEGDVLEVTASDPGFYNDIKAWVEKTENTLINIEKTGKNIIAKIRKGINQGAIVACSTPRSATNDHKTIVVFSGDLDKAIASFIIASGAAAMGKKVTMFFTFWGLNVLRKHERISIRKDIMSQMFGKMMPRGSRKLGLSKMNMGGMGASMIRGIMNKKKISSLEELMNQALENGVTLMACQMSMDVMGIHKEELLDGVEIGGVATYLAEAEESNVNLFI